MLRMIRLGILFTFALMFFGRLDAAQIAASPNGGHVLQVVTGGAVWAWGANGSGQLGDGTFVNHAIPQLLTGISSVTAVAAGASHSLALKSDGTVWAWGANSNGQLGDGTFNTHQTPNQVPGLTNIIAIAAGANHSLALKNDGSVWAWGFNGNGQLGDNTTTQRPSPVAVVTSGGLTNVTAIAAGANHSLAIKSGGSVWAWGLNGNGQVGDGTTVNKLVPTQVTSFTGVATGISGGFAHTLAVKDDGTAWAWGLNAAGQLGDNTTTNRSTPVQVNSITGVSAVSAGNNHSLALKNDGTVWAWGLNNLGQLGDTTTTQRLTPVQAVGITGATEIAAASLFSVARLSGDSILTWGGDGAGQLGDGVTLLRPVPMQISGLSDVAQAAAGGGHTLALLNNGTVMGLGNNANGQLGDNSTTRRTSPVAVSGLTNITAIAAGSLHSLARKNDGTVWAWGFNGNGQLGNNTTTQQQTPVQVVGIGGTGFLANISGISASGTNNFSLAVDNTGAVFAWGVNASGQLGDGTFTQRNAPVAVTGLSGVFTAVSAGNNHSLALRNDGTVWAWGGNNNGQLGVGDFVTRSSPIQVFGLTGIVAIAAGSQASFALRNDGSVWAWGSNNAIPGVFQQTTPQAFGDLPPTLSIAAGNGYTLFIIQIGTNKWVGGWGGNSGGQLGTGTFDFSNSGVPALAFAGKVPASISANNFSLAVMTDGTVWGWGLDTFGQLGDDPVIYNTTPTAPVARGVADLKISKTHVGNFSAGSPGSYTITVTNVGQATMTGTITVTDTLPAGMSFTSGSGPGWTCSGVTGGASCTNPGPLAAGASSVITLNVNTTAAMFPDQFNLATVSNTNDVHALNNTTGDETSAQTPTTVAVTSVSPNPSTLGQPVSVTVTVTPSGVPGNVFAADVRDGGTLVGMLPASSGTAQVSTIMLQPGTRQLEALFLPDPSSPYSFSQSPVVNQTVNAAPAASLAAASTLILGGSKAGYLVANADFNGDSKMDLAVVDPASHNVTIYLGNGSGGFTTSAGGPFQTGSTPVAVLAVDLNGDNKADLVFANQSLNAVTVLLGDGAGGFAAAPGTPFPVGFSPTSMTTEDLNGDGTLRVAVTGLNSAQFAKLKHDKLGGFFVNTFSVPSGSRSGITSADFNNDGIFDLAMADPSGAVGIDLKDPNGGYVGLTSVTSTIHPQGILAADLNGDGKADLVGYDSTGIEILIGNGSGGFSEAMGSPFVPGTGAITAISSVQTSDFNGDGKPDLFVVRTPSATSKGEVVIMLGNGNGGFTLAAGAGFAYVSSNLLNAVVADFTGDGRADVAVTDPGNDGVVILKGVAGSPVSAVSVGPGSGTGAVQTFSANYAAAGDYHDLQWVQMLFAVATDGGGQAFCYVHYDVVGNKFWLYSDVLGFFVGPISPGTPSNLLQGSLCALNTSGSSANGYGSQLIINASVVFKQAKVLNIYTRAYTLAGADTGWVQQGSWTTAAASLGTMTVSPSSGSVTNGTQQTFTLTYPDTQGFAGAAFGWEQFLVAVASNGGGQPFCYVHYDRGGNGLWMYSSDVGYFLGPVTPGTASNALNSSACSVNTGNATVQNTGGNLVLAVPVTLKGPMAGAQKLFQRALTVLNVDTNWVQTGTFTVN